eukprot:TRINITY_DN12787_c0_g1_i1.p2 TRINITY_DN12787_c0_g1~~TRINITY_DN12787_c0_g1_i1.p2  ORF type:complete len:116 (+),score=3.56 TRINITY_DN12787_c0_g1_i1:367-714(+)
MSIINLYQYVFVSGSSIRQCKIHVCTQSNKKKVLSRLSVYITPILPVLLNCQSDTRIFVLGPPSADIYVTDTNSISKMPILTINMNNIIRLHLICYNRSISNISTLHVKMDKIQR